MKPPSLVLVMMALAMLVAAGSVAADDVVAIKAKTVATAAGKEIRDGVILVKDGKIEAVGKADKVKIPAGATVLEADFVMPGLVNIYSRLGVYGSASPLSARGGGTSRFTNKSDTNPTVELYPRQKIFEELLEVGVTTQAIVPGSGGGITGTVSVLKPHGTTAKEMVVKEGALLRVGFGGGSGGKSGLKTLLDRAKSEEEKVAKAKKRRADWEKREAKKRQREEEKAKKAAKKKGASKTKPEPEEKKPKKKSEGPKVPEMKTNLKPVVAARNKKIRVLLEIPSAAILDHFFDVLKDRHQLDLILVLNGRTAVKVKDTLKEKKIPVLLSPVLATRENTTIRINPAAALEAAGIEFAFRSTTDRVSALRTQFFNLATMVKCGLSRGAAVKAVTATPAKWLGLDKSLGSVAKGKAANLLLFEGDPLRSPLAELKKVLLEGRVVHDADENKAKENLK